MKFAISRTSIGGDSKPCKEAKPCKIKYVDQRTCKTPEEFDARLARFEGKWLENGTNHRIINGHIARDIGTKDCWAIELNSLEDLMALYHKYGKLIIEANWYDGETPNIEIYDDYRE